MSGGGGGGGVAPRHTFSHGGRVVYEWEQSLEDVTLYVRTPPGVSAAQIACTISAGHVRLGLKGNPPFLDHDTAGAVAVRESTWLMGDGGELQIILAKARKAEAWPAALRGHGELDAAAHEAARKAILLERFQEEHPGFDFRGADVTGAVPDPREFMGGMKRA